MRKILYTTLILLGVCFTAMAQQGGKPITTNGLQMEITGETLELGLHIKAEGLEIKCGGELTLELAIENDDHRRVLPIVVYSGGLRYRYEQRRALLSDSYTPEPYHTYMGVKKNKTYELDYKLSIPYYKWMEHARVTLRQYTHDCAGARVTGSDVLIADLNPTPVYVEPEIWLPDPALYAHLVRFLVPEVEEVKARASMLELRIGFPVNVTEVRPEFGDNRYELSRADSLVQALQQKSNLITINHVNIHGYASPEGTYAANERLARGRSESFKQYLIRNYPANDYIRSATTMWTPEDWEGFGRLIVDCDIPGKADVLAIVNDPDIAPDTKDRMLQRIVWWSNNYKVILKEMYPRLRRIELRVDYTVNNFTDAEAREYLYTQPDLLSLNEIYRVANYYEPGSNQYREVYEIAARQFPNDMVANNNAAAALLREGKADESLPYLEKTKGDENSLINYGAYHYIKGDLERSMEYFNKANEAGIEQAGQIIKLADPAQKR